MVESPLISADVAGIRPVREGCLFSDPVAARRIHGARAVHIDGLRVRVPIGASDRKGAGVMITS